MELQLRLIWSFAFVLLFLPALVVGDDHIVGANHGWQVPAEAGVDLNYSTWATNETFYLGDFISFHYQKGLHTVYEVNRSVYESCDFGNGGSPSAEELWGGGVAATIDKTSVIHNWSTKGGRSIVPLNESRVYYFACGVGQHCLQGMKVAVSVLPTTSSNSPLSAQQQSSNYYPHSSSSPALQYCPLSPLIYLCLVLCMHVLSGNTFANCAQFPLLY
ncbi:hypothetical protein GOP47_0013652 [Adiantum capillus-veneris]|uniref:Phytocyanin domain-containing protein n=1 Tax=Adiantum capillus-veneris TaxID=13818 RepID=A0A9D4UPM4_ADICA|nr:hypothetical protein GOP47_0013652 [Adiantum capillus-veneris]